MQIIAPEIKMITDSPKGYEIDPTKLDSGESLEDNTKRLLNACEQFLGKIMSNMDCCPLAFRVCKRFL